MATEIEESPPPATLSVAPYPVTVEQFTKMIDAGVFGESDRVELLEGVLAAKMTKSAPHEFATERLGELLRQMMGPGWMVREEKSVSLGRYWRPEPDLAVVVGPSTRYRKTPPEAGDVRLLVEVADSSYARDRGEKWRGYAGAGVPSYWIVNLDAPAVEVSSGPIGRGDSARYEVLTTFGPEAVVPVVIEGKELGKIAVKDILP